MFFIRKEQSASFLYCQRLSLANSPRAKTWDSFLIREKNNWCVLEASRVKEKLAVGIEERKYWGPREAVVVLHMLDRESSKQRCGQVLIC